MQSAECWTPNFFVSQTYKSLFCPVCQDAKFEDEQPHLLQCEKLISDSIITKDLPEYEDLFTKDVDKVVVVVRLLKENLGKRRKILKKNK